MPANQFICPNNDKILIETCLKNCPHAERCMAKPTLAAVAHSVADRGLAKHSVTELLRGTREVYLQKTTDYAVSPNDQMFAIHGSAVHLVGENNTDESILTEIRLENDIFTGQIDAYGDILGNGKKVLLDYKVSSSFKAMTALGYYSVEEPTGEIFKTGARKGQFKTKKVWKTGGVRKILDWAIQINCYRMLMEEHNMPVDDMYIQIYVRDFSAMVAGQGRVTKPIYLIKVNKISDHWLKIYFEAKRKQLEEALMNGEMPPPCRNNETWNSRKCQDYCNVADTCKKYEEESKKSSDAEDIDSAA